MAKFARGDCVYLNSGGPEMVVINPDTKDTFHDTSNEGASVRVAWFAVNDTTNVYRDIFPEEALYKKGEEK